MEIQKELQQKRFESEKQKLVLNVLFTAGWLDCQATRVFKPHGLSPQQYNVLRILRGQHPQAASANLIATRMIDRSSNVSRLIDKLLEKGLVTRQENSEDRRSISVAITRKGLDLLERIGKEVPELAKTMKGVTEAEARMASDVLDRMRGP
jgi:DNA-binding MarR family transcriptional regulator